MKKLSVKSICDEFTTKLEKVRVQQKQIQKNSQARQITLNEELKTERSIESDALTEARAASKAIDNIKKMFGQ